MLDFRVVSVEKTNYFEFSVTAIAKFVPAITTYSGHRFIMKSEHVIVVEFDI